GVVEEEKRARAVDEFRYDQRTADGRAEALLQIVRLRRRLAVERIRRCVERRGASALVDAAADLIAAATAAEAGAEGAAAESTAPAESAGVERTSESPTAAWQRAVGRGAIGAEPLREISRPVAAEERIVGVRRSDRGDRFGRGLGRKSRRQHRGRIAGDTVVVGSALRRRIGPQRQILKRLRRLTARALAASSRTRCRRRRLQRR